MASNQTGSVVAARMRSPVTWLSAAATLTGLYTLYQFQYERQKSVSRSAGKPDLGGPWALKDPHGKPVSSDDLKGQWVLLYFGFTKCPDICPQELEKTSAVLQSLEGKGHPVLPVFITIDPHRDTPQRLQSYFGKGHAFHPRTLALTGSDDAIKKACRAFRVYFSKPTADEIKQGDYLLDHSIINYLIDPEGNFADYYGKSLSSAEMEGRMLKLISDWKNDKWWRENMPAFLAPAPPPAAKRDDARKAAAKAA